MAEDANEAGDPEYRSADRTSGGSAGECVELDAMPPRELRSLVTNAITSLIDWYEREQLKQVEREEKQTFELTLAGFIASENGEINDDSIPF